MKRGTGWVLVNLLVVATLLVTSCAPGQRAAPEPAPTQTEEVTLRFVPVAGSGVSGEITLRPRSRRWSEGMEVTVTVTGVTKIREHFVSVFMFSEPNCPFEAAVACFYDPADPKVDHASVFEEGLWTRTGFMVYQYHPGVLYNLPPGTKTVGSWRGRDDLPIQEQIKSIGILGYSRTVPVFMATVLAGVNLSGEPLNVVQVQTEEYEPIEGPEDITPVTVRLQPVGGSGVYGEARLRPYEYKRVGQTCWYRCYADIVVYGIKNMPEEVIAFLSSAPDGQWEHRLAYFYDQWKGRLYLVDGASMLWNAWTTARFDCPPGWTGRGGGWHAVRSKMVSVGIYNTKTKTVLAYGNIPSPQVTLPEGRRMEKVKVEKIDHVMICVRNLDKAIAFYSDLLGIEFYRVEPSALRQWGIGAAVLSSPGIELVEATSPGGEATRFIGWAGEAPLGVAFKVPDLEEAVAAMQSRGIRLLARESVATRKVAVFEPKDTFNVMIKLVEYVPAYTVADLEVVTRWRDRQKLTLAVLPKVEKVDHVMIHVNDVEEAARFFANLFGTTFPEPVQLGPAYLWRQTTDGLGIELSQGTSPDSPITRFIEARRTDKVSGEGLALFSVEVSNFEEVFSVLQSRGIRLYTKREFPTRRVAVFARTGALGHGIEIIEYKPLAHPIVCLEMRQELEKGR